MPIKETKIFGLSGKFTKSSCHHAKVSAKNVAKKLRRRGFKVRISEEKRNVWYPHCVWKTR